jgi:hypothetical protein
VGGVPAKEIRDRFPDKIKEKLLATKWWNMKLEVLKTLPCDNVFRFIDSCSGLDETVWDSIETLSVD